MEYISLDDIRDEILQCTDDDLTMGNDTIEHLASKLGVSEIKLPVKAIVKRLGVASACYNRCLMQAGTDPTATFNGANGMENSDIYAQKLKLYKAEMQRLLETITSADFGVTGGRGRCSIALYRS